MPTFSFIVDRKAPGEPVAHIEPNHGECRREFAGRTVPLGTIVKNWDQGAWRGIVSGTMGPDGKMLSATIDCKLL